ncbi:putative protein RIC-3-like [Scophthalmus maximus]|uniref:Resistance to inhibitors of cholinesterase protein 3 N-terminal domain-containing protein n=1 Tax=Scophthalmus maximus TaxID=52904 RepID=A0A2U9BCA5_SCOMX|nr:putative protein RIC-3-like [Scophthalmus maximus]
MDQLHLEADLRSKICSQRVGPGFYRPVMHRLPSPEDSDEWGVELSHSMTHSAEAMAKVKIIGRGKKYNLMAQVIPIYGFGILLYIIYIIYKLTCKKKTTKSRNYSTVIKTDIKCKIMMEAESLQFSCEGCPNPEEEAEEDKEEYSLLSAPEEGDDPIQADMPKEVGVSGLRMRNRRET